MTKEQIEHIEDLIAEANYRDSYDFYNSVYNELKEMEKAANQPDYLIYYYKGLVQYTHADSEEESRSQIALDCFHSALEINPKHIMSIIYIGYCFYDLGKYKIALKHFNEILTNKEYVNILVKNYQKWRLTNIKELKATIFLKFGKVNNYLASYFRWKDIFSKLDSDSFYFPRNLIVDTAAFLKNKGDGLSMSRIKSFKAISAYLIDLIKKHDLEDLYAKELEDLQNWDGHEQPQRQKVYS